MPRSERLIHKAFTRQGKNIDTHFSITGFYFNPVSIIRDDTTDLIRLTWRLKQGKPPFRISLAGLERERARADGVWEGEKRGGVPFPSVPTARVCAKQGDKGEKLAS